MRDAPKNFSRKRDVIVGAESLVQGLNTLALKNGFGDLDGSSERNK